MYNGDYRHLASLVWQNRTSDDNEALIIDLIDNSLGITATHDAQLQGEAEARWLGDINLGYHTRRTLTPTANVGDEFRADWPIGRNPLRAAARRCRAVVRFHRCRFEKASPQAFFDTLPKSVSFAPLRFATPTGPSLYEQWLARELKH